MVNIPDKYLNFVEIDGQKIRYLKMPAKNPQKKNVAQFMLNGHHSSVERIYPLLRFGRQFGNVYCVEPPGFGVSERFEGREPTFANYAEFFSKFIDKVVDEEEVIFTGSSFGFIVGTILLQNYEAIRKRVKGFVGIVGFVDVSAISIPEMKRRLLGAVLRIFRYRRLADFLQKYIIGSDRFMNWAINKFFITPQYEDFSDEEKKAALEFDIWLWRVNDLYTNIYSLTEILALDVTDKSVDTPLHFVYTTNDQYFDHEKLPGSIREVYKDVKFYPIKMPFHAPRFIDSIEEYKPLVPDEVVEYLSR